MIRPGIRGAAAGANRSVSTPSGTVCSCSGSTPKSSAISAADDDDTVTRSGMRRATRFCMVAKPYQRRTAGLRHQRAAARSRSRSRVIGWCTVATTGRYRAMSNNPVPRHWLSCTTSNSSRRAESSLAARRLKVRGSGKPAVHMVASSRASMRSRISRGWGTRNGSGSR